jgi:hypothetical protein
MTRRKFLRSLGLGILAAGSGSGLVYSAVYELYAVEIVRQTVRLPENPLFTFISAQP